jgi:hypothetical protein
LRIPYGVWSLDFRPERYDNMTISRKILKKMKKVLDSYMVLCVASWGSILLEQDMLRRMAGNRSDWLPEFRADNNDNEL